MVFCPVCFTVAVPPFYRGDNFQSQILKRGDKKKKSAWGHLKVPALDNCLEGLTVFCKKKRLLKIKYGFDDSVSYVDLGLF